MDDREAELDGMRIRQLATLRRATYRSRSHAIIAAGVCAVAGIQFLIMIVGSLRANGLGARAAGYVAGFILGIWGTIYFMKRAMAFHRETQKPAIAPPLASPDFSSLGDGREFARRLENIE